MNNQNIIKVDYSYVENIKTQIEAIKEELTTNQREGRETISALRNEGLLKTEKTEAVLSEVENQFTKIQEYIDYLTEFKNALDQFINTYMTADQ